jgi:hypothetical protein
LSKRQNWMIQQYIPWYMDCCEGMFHELFVQLSRVTTHLVTIYWPWLPLDKAAKVLQLRFYKLLFPMVESMTNPFRGLQAMRFFVCQQYTLNKKTNKFI